MNEFQNVFPWLRHAGPARANDLENFNVVEFLQALWNEPETNDNSGSEHPMHPPTGAPPASARAIRQLPTICVRPEDLVDPSNRECCICLDAISLGEKVMRIPCAHIFHQDCIVDWLTNHHCTCPVCRYELQTDSPMYEAGRLERMKTRKPRFAMYELKRMSVAELLALNRRPAPGVLDKDCLISTLIREESIEIIPSPEPVEYDIDTLRRMRIGELKRTMEDAGVFFHAKDVVEKSDMLAIFLNSGRLSLRRTESKPSAAKVCSSTPLPISFNDPNCSKSIASGKRPFVETVEEDSDTEPELKKSGKRSLSPQVEMFGSSSQNLDGQGSSDCLSYEVNEDSKSMETDQADSEPMQSDSIPDNCSKIGVDSSTEGAQTSSPAGVGTEPSSGRLDHTSGTKWACEMCETSQGQSTRGLHKNATCPAYAVRGTCPFEGYTVSHLRDLARVNNVDLSSCFERSDIVRLLTSARIEMKHPSEILRDSLGTFSISELRVISSEVKIDVSHCSNKEDMLHCMVQESTVGRPYIQKYLRALSPLSTLSLAQLKQTARDRGININDCLERGEIVQRLITSRRTTKKSSTHCC